MANSNYYIPSGGVREIDYDLNEKAWYIVQSTEKSNEKEIPLLKLITNLRGIAMKNCTILSNLGKYDNYSREIIEIIKICSSLKRRYIKIDMLCRDLFSTAEIDTIDYVMYIYNQWENNEQLDYPLFMSQDITDTLPKLQKERLRFERDIIKCYKVITKLEPKN